MKKALLMILLLSILSSPAMAQVVPDSEISKDAQRFVEDLAKKAGDVGDIQKHADVLGKVTEAIRNNSDETPDEISQEAAKNEFYQAMAAKRRGDQKVCTITRGIAVKTDQHIRNVRGNFLTVGVGYQTDIRTCTTKRTYEETRELVPGEDRVETHTGVLSCFGSEGWYQSVYDAPCWFSVDGGRNYSCGNVDDCVNERLKPSCSAPIERLRMIGSSGGMRSSGEVVDVSYSEAYEKTCEWDGQTQEITVWKEKINDGCTEVPARCELINEELDPGTQNFGGTDYTHDWWNKKSYYACERAYECSSFADTGGDCGNWYAPQESFQGCMGSLLTGVKAMAADRYSNLVTNFSCESWSQSSLPMSSGDYATIDNSFPNGCGRYVPDHPDVYNFLSKDQGKNEVNCKVPEPQMPAPAVLLKVVDTSEPIGNNVTVDLRTYDYFEEGIADTCQDLIQSHAARGVTCRLVSEVQDGTMTKMAGTKLTEAEVLCKTIKGGLDDYDFCPEFWQKLKTYQCIENLDLGFGVIDPDQDITSDQAQSPDNQADGLGEALGNLGAMEEIGNAVGTDSECADGGSVDGCNLADIRVFGGSARECKKFDLEYASQPDADRNQNCCNNTVMSAVVDTGGNRCGENDNTTFRLTQSGVCVALPEEEGDSAPGEKCVLEECVLYPGLIEWSYDRCPTWLRTSTCAITKKVYCCFTDKLAHAFQTQGRAMISKSFGTVDEPNCEGFTVEELTTPPMDLSKIDLTEALGLDEIIKPSTPDQAGIDDAKQDGQNDLKDQVTESMADQGYSTGHDAQPKVSGEFDKPEPEPEPETQVRQDCYDKTEILEPEKRETICVDETYEISPAGVNQTQWRCRWQIFHGCGGAFWKEAGWSREGSNVSGCTDYSGWSPGAVVEKTCYPPGSSNSPIPYEVYWDQAVYGTRQACHEQVTPAVTRVRTICIDNEEVVQ